MSELKGICVPVCTPFTDDGAALDEAVLLRHLDSMIEAGVHIIAVCGGTGEFPFLTTEEKRRIAELSARHIDGRARLIVQTSAIRTEDAVEASKHAEGCGEIGIDPLVHPWDVAPLLVIVEEAGGRATDRNGERSIYQGSLVTSNGLLHDTAVEALRDP